MSRFERLYGKCHASFNVHILQHAAQSVRNWGPLWCQSAFIFESHNGNLQKLFHGTQAVTEQIANSFSLFQSIPRLLSTVYDKSVKKTSTDFVDRMLRGYRLATNCVKKTNIIFLGLPTVRMPTPREAFLFREQGIDVHQCAFYSRAIINGNRIHSKTSTTLSRRINHAVVTEQGTMALVRLFVDVGFDKGFAFIDPVITAKFNMVKDRQTGTAFSGIVRENYISTDVKLINCNEIRTTCVYLKDVGLVQNLLCIQPNMGSRLITILFLSSIYIHFKNVQNNHVKHLQLIHDK